MGLRRVATQEAWSKMNKIKSTKITPGGGDLFWNITWKWFRNIRTKIVIGGGKESASRLTAPLSCLLAAKMFWDVSRMLGRTTRVRSNNLENRLLWLWNHLCAKSCDLDMFVKKDVAAQLAQVSVIADFLLPTHPLLFYSFPRAVSYEYTNLWIHYIHTVQHRSYSDQDCCTLRDITILRCFEMWVDCLHVELLGYTHESFHVLRRCCMIPGMAHSAMSEEGGLSLVQLNLYEDLAIDEEWQWQGAGSRRASLFCLPPNLRLAFLECFRKVAQKMCGKAADLDGFSAKAIATLPMPALQRLVQLFHSFE